MTLSTTAALRAGEHTLVGPTTGSGLLSAYLASIGTFTRAFSVENSSYGIWTTTTVAGSKAGFRTNAGITSRGMDLTLTCRFKITSDTGVNFFIGLVDDAAPQLVTTGVAADPLNNLDGIGLSVHGGNIKVGHNDATITEAETTVFDDFVEPVLFESRAYDITIQSTNSTDGNMLVSIASPSTDPSPITATGCTLSSSLPDPSRGLALQVFVETTTALNKSIEVYSCSGAF